MSLSSDSGLDTPITEQIAQVKQKSTQKKRKKKTEHGPKNEGTDPHWAYAPPEGTVLLDHAAVDDSCEFEWDAVKDDEDTEIWLIRVPDTIKAKHLKGLEMDPPSSSRTARIGGLTRKDVSYDVWSVADDDAEVGRAEELRSLACLLPRKRKGGKLYIAPKRVSRHVVVVAHPPTANNAEHQHTIYQNPLRPSYPKELLKHTFLPYGARSQQSQSEVLMDVDDVESMVEKPADTTPSQKDRPVKTKESNGKKRSKVDGESPKKLKKRKSNA